METPDRRQNSSLLDNLGSELISILVPVSTCMLLVVILVRALNGVGTPFVSSGFVVYAENPSASNTEKLGGAILNALIIVGFVTVVTFLIVALFYFRCTRCIRIYTNFSVFSVLCYMGAVLGALIVQTFSIPIDIISFVIFFFNFGVVGVLVVLPSMPVPIIFTQGYLVLIGVIAAFWFTFFPEWTTWTLLLAMAAYDVVAVLVPGGPLNLLLELSMKRQEQIPALIYESRPVVRGDVPAQQQQMRRWRRRRLVSTAPSASSDSFFKRIFGFAPPNSEEFPQETERHDTAGEGSMEVESVNLRQEVDEEQSRNNEEEALLLARRRSTNPASNSRILGSAYGNNDSEEVSSQSSAVALQEEASGTSEEYGYAQGGTSVQEGNQSVQDRIEEQEVRNRNKDEESVPLISRHIEHRVDTVSGLIAHEEQAGQALAQEELPQESDIEAGRIESVMEGGIKLGLGDFIFYSVLVGRAAMFDLMTVWSCYLAIVSGLAGTLVLLAVWRRALPALPLSISLGVLFYFLTRLIVEPFVMQLDTRLVFF